MKPDPDETIYETWLSRRREDFATEEISFLVMKAIRAECVPQHAGRQRALPFLGVPSTLIGIGRLILFAFIILTPS